MLVSTKYGLFVILDLTKDQAWLFVARYFAISTVR